MATAKRTSAESSAPGPAEVSAGLARRILGAVLLVVLFVAGVWAGKTVVARSFPGDTTDELVQKLAHLDRAGISYDTL